MSKKNILFQEIDKFIDLYSGKKIILYGAGSAGKFVLAAFIGYNLDVLYFVDGDENKQGKTYMGLEVKSPYDLLNENPENIVIVLTLSASDEAEKVLHGMGFVNGKNYYCMGSVERQKAADIFDPFLGFSRMDDLEGFKFFGDASARKKILTLGGSTTDYSVSGINSWPYYLHKLFEKSAINCQVINGGIGGYYSGQELLKLLRDGIFLKPDMVISYSGINDALGCAYKEGYPLVNKYLQDTIDNLPIKDKKIGYGYIKEVSRADNWLMNTRMMHAICEEFGIPFYSFLQPFVWTGNYGITEQEKIVFSFIDGYIDPNSRRQFYDEIVEKIEKYSYIYDFTDIFAGKTGIYYDICHCNEEGNEIIATKIYEVISQD